MFFNDLSEVLQVRLSTYTIHALIFPLCSRAQRNKDEGKPWDEDRFKDELALLFERYYECEVSEAPKLFGHILAAIQAKMPVYQQ